MTPPLLLLLLLLCMATSRDISRLSGVERCDVSLA